MSRIGKLSVLVPKEVKLDYNENHMSVKGPKGALEMEVPQGVDIKIEDSKIFVLRRGETRDDRRLQGLARSLINNMVNGVAKGFQKQLSIVGVGYKAEVKGDVLNLTLGYSHPINFEIPKGIGIAVDKQTSITVTGADKQLVGAVASKIRSYRTPDPYKGKGIKYAEEHIRRKVGKTGKK